MDPPADSSGAQQNQTGQNMNDIQNFLVTFNKEIAGGQPTGFVPTAGGAFQAVQQDGNNVTQQFQAFQPGQAFAQTSQQFTGDINYQQQAAFYQAQPAGVAQLAQFQSNTGELQNFSVGQIQFQAAPAQGGTLAMVEPTGTIAVSSDTQSGETASTSEAPSEQPQISENNENTAAAQSDDLVQTAVIVTDGQKTEPTQSGSEEDQQMQQETPLNDTTTAVPSDSLQMLADVTSGQSASVPTSSGATATSTNSSVLLNSGSSYQTVTIVPSEVNQGGEVSYVLIVSQPEDNNKDMSVYDFKEKEGDNEDEDVEDEDGTPRKIKATPKKGAQGVLMCNYCNYTSPKRYLLTRHMKCHSEERPHKCSICDRGFKTIASLQNHINTHTGVRPHKCQHKNEDGTDCECAFTTSGELVRHVRYRHTFVKPHKCPECDYASVELSKLKRHMRSHTGERPYACPHCTYASPDTYKLKRHLRIHTGEKPYECSVCHARFTQSNSLKAHRLIHSGNKPVYQCDLCPTTCGRKTDLKIHVQKLHTSDRPLPCKKCPKSFPDRYSYKLHMKTHDGEKCFKCDFCPYAALSSRFLETHVLTHTGEKPFNCEFCEATFRQKQLLKRHVNLYHTPGYEPPPKKDKTHQCTECPKMFAHKGNLLRHMVQHDPTNPMYQQAAAEADANIDEDEEEEDISVDTQGIIESVVQAYHEEVQQGEPSSNTEEDQEQYDSPPQQGRHPNKRGRPPKKLRVDEHHEGVPGPGTVQIQTDQQGDSGQVILLQMESGEVIRVQPSTLAHTQISAPAANETPDVAVTDSDVVNVETQEISPQKEAQVEATSPKTPSRRSTRRSTRQSVTAEEETPAPPVEQPAVESTEESPRITRGRKRTAAQESPEITTPSKKVAKKQESPRRKTRSSVSAGDEDNEDRKREEQKKKDIETCFGFEDVDSGKGK